MYNKAQERCGFIPFLRKSEHEQFQLIIDLGILILFSVAVRKRESKGNNYIFAIGVIALE